MRELGRGRSYFFSRHHLIHQIAQVLLLIFFFCFVLFIFVLLFLCIWLDFRVPAVSAWRTASLFVALLTLCMEITSPFLRLCRRNEIGDYGTTFEPLRGDHGHNVKLKTILRKIDAQDWIF